MRTSITSLAILTAIIVLQPAIPTFIDQASAVPFPSGGRAEPPVNGSQWDITTVQNITTDVDFAGNITILNNAQLRIMNGARLRILTNDAFHYLISVETGGSVQVENNSILDADHYKADNSTGLTVQGGSIVRARGLFDAQSNCFINDSSISVTGSSGKSPGEDGSPARLVLNPNGKSDQIKNCVLTVTAGDGASAVDLTGMAGGAGGDATLMMHSHDFSTVRATVRSGHGGNGGTGGGTSVAGGAGGRGGNLALQMNGEIVADTVITGLTGYGGNGSIGYNSPNGDGGQGGRGGDGGSVDFRWNGAAIDISSSNISVIAANAGRGGDGGVAQTRGNGGSGGDGGTGGSVAAAIESKGTFTISDSSINFLAGFGPTGGNYGRASSSSGFVDGRAGEGGAGGSATCGINLTDSFSSTNSSLMAVAGDAGNGGAGSAGAKGGTGGTGRLSFGITGLTTEPTFSCKLRSLVSRGGKGGDGGRGQGTALKPGQPGDGGKGGGARLEIISGADIKSVDISGAELACDPGAPGAAVPPADYGNPGVGDIYIMTKSLLMRNCTVTQRMWPVDDNDLWVLESTKIPESDPFAVSEGGVAEVYYRLRCNVKDINGNLITDGSATVDIKLNGETVGVSQTNSFGWAEFLKLGARYVANPEETVRIITYVASAVSEDGNFTKPVSVQLTGDKTVDLVLIQKSHLPVAAVESPNDKITAIIYATNYLRDNGTTEPYSIEGSAADSVFNTEQSITNVEIRIGDGPWISVNLTMPNFNSYKWTYSWDIYNWALDQLTRFPLGIIPAPIAARSFNERFYSNEVQQNITVYLLRIPPPLPVVVITKPVPSTRENPNSTEVNYEKSIPFDARVINASGTRIIKWAWCFDDLEGYWNYSSPYFPSTNVSYNRDQNDKYMYAILKVFDNESARRVELLRGGLSYSEFKYDFEPDGSTIVRLRIHVLPIPPPPQPPWWLAYSSFIAAGIVVIVMMAGAVMIFQIRTKQIIQKREKEERESFKVELADLTCARCGEPLADATAGCLQCRAQDTLSVVQQSILRLKDSGVNISDAEKVLEEGVDAFDSKSFQEAITKANTAKDRATQLENKYNETATLIAGWETKVADIRVNTPEADLTEPETKVYHARLALGRGDHAEAVKHLDGLEPMLMKASKAGMRKGTQELIESTKRMIANIEKRGIILDKKVMVAVDQAAFALQQSEYELAQEHCKEAEALVKDTNRVFIKASAALRQSEERVLDAKGAARPLGTTEELLKQARDAMTVGSYSSVAELTGKILGFFGVSAKAPAPKRVDWKKEVTILEGMGAQPAGAGARPSAAPGAKPVIVAAAPPPVLEMEVSPDLKEAAEKMMREATDAIASARELALDVSDGEDLLEKAKESYKARRYPESSELSKSAKFLMQELAGAAGAKLRPRVTAPVTPAAAPAAAKAPAPAVAPPAAATEPKLSIDKAEALIAQLAQLGADVSGLETMLMRAKSARDGGSPVVALQFAKDALNQGEDLMREYETAKKNFGLAERLLAVAKTRSLDTADAEFHLRQARNAMAGGAFGRVADTSVLVMTILKELDPTLEMEAAAPKPAPAAPALTAGPAPTPPAAVLAPAAEMVPCPSCSRTVKASWKSCPFCGSKIAPAEKKPLAPVPAAPAPSTAPAPTIPVLPLPTAPAPSAAPTPTIPAAPVPAAPVSACPKCKAAVKPHWKVCPSCGSALVPSALAPPVPAAVVAPPAEAAAQERCPACGARIRPGMTECSLCKTPLLPDAGARPGPEPPKKAVTVSKPVIAPPAASPAAPAKPAPVAPPSAASPAPSKPLIVPPTPSPPTIAPGKTEVVKRIPVKVLKKKVIVVKKKDEEE